MLVARITVTGTEIRSERLVPITSGMIGATVEVSFDESWDGYTLTYVWKHGRLTIDDLDATGEIPAEVLERPGGWLNFGVYGTKEDKALPTLWVTIGAVNSGADPSGDESADPTLPVWAQLEAEMEELRKAGVSDERISSLIGDYMKANPVEHPTKVSAFVNDAGYLTKHQALSGYVQKADLKPFGIVADLETMTTDKTSVDALNALVSGKTVLLGLNDELIVPVYALDQGSMTVFFSYVVDGMQLLLTLNGNTLTQEVFKFASKDEIPTDEHINDLISTALAAIPNAAEVAY